ncbi:MAG: hypothetical protein GY754_24450 [bacterium]|nr:hypothetical protein [bacterium]
MKYFNKAQRKHVFSLIIILFFATCHYSKQSNPNNSKSLLKPAAIASGLKYAGSAYFRVDPHTVDVYPVCTNAQGYGVYTIYNKSIKGARAVFIAAKQGIIPPRSKQSTFRTAALSGHLLKKLPKQATLAAELFLMFSPKKSTYGLLITDAFFQQGAHNTKEIQNPKAEKDGSGFEVEFWTKNINTDYFYHLTIKIKASGEVSIDSEDKTKFK